MNVNGIQNANNPYAGNTADRNAMGQQEFLQLLVAQMKNQDPINPMDGTEFASQLAQFNSVEQLIGVNSALTGLQQSQNLMSAGLTNSMAAALTGKEVKALSNQFNLQENSSLDFSYKIPKSATEVEIIIKDENGNQVSVIQLKACRRVSMIIPGMALVLMGIKCLMGNIMSKLDLKVETLLCQHLPTPKELQRELNLQVLVYI